MRTSATTLGVVAGRLGVETSAPDVVVSDVHHDSRSVTHGALFVAIPGAEADGHDFVPAAVANGAAAVVVERPTSAAVPELVVQDARAALAVAARAVHGDPESRMKIAGVTGTNGKTTVTKMVEAIADRAGCSAGVIGTLGARAAGRDIEIARTTPEASDLYRILATMADAGVEIAAMEVSSHALALNRVDGLRFDVAAFTNLSQDHLDFHGDLESYLGAKALLFEVGRAATAVVYIDDEAGRRIAAGTPLPVTTVSASGPADVYATGIDTRGDGNRFTLHAEGRSVTLDMPVPASFNVANALVAAAVCLELGIAFDDIAAGLSELPQVPGRFEAVHGNWPFAVVVDYAHTPRAVTAAIDEARRLTDGKVVTVVGAGGDRDQDKRPMMGRAASSADLAVITSDNPRSEDPAAIIEAVVAGVDPEGHVIVEVDRRRAIRAAFAAAGQGDIVLILGKGHEQGQDFGGGRVEPFDDRVVARTEAAAVCKESA